MILPDVYKEVNEKRRANYSSPFCFKLNKTIILHYYFLLFFLSAACVNTAAAKLLVSLEEFGFDSAFPALVAISLDVFSFFAIW
jgi:hypothetical protein